VGQVYSTRILQERATTGHSIVLPPGFLWVLRDITVYNGNAFSEVDMTVYGVDGTILWFASDSLPGTGVWHHDEVRIVMYEGETLGVTAGMGCDFTLSGYMLALP